MTAWRGQPGLRQGIKPPGRLALFLLGAVALVAWLPILAVLLTIATVMATGCEVNEAAVHPCLVAGHDIGDALGSGLLMIFAAAPALPVALGATIVWLVWWRRRRRAAPGG